MSVCLSVSNPSVCPLTCHSIRLSHCLIVCLPVTVSACLSDSVHLSVFFYLFINLSIPSVDVSTCRSLCVPVCLQCGSPLPGLRSKETCCRGVGKAWGITECVLCPPHSGTHTHSQSAHAQNHASHTHLKTHASRCTYRHTSTQTHSHTVMWAHTHRHTHKSRTYTLKHPHT